MTRMYPILTLALLLGATSQAATTNTTLTVTNATGSFSASGISATGPATFTNGIPSGTFKATLSLTPTGSNYVAPFTITLTTNDTITGNLLIPQKLVTDALSGSSSGNTGNGSAVITGGTGAYAGATGSFPTLSATLGGSILTSFTISFSGAGTITTGGTGGGGTTTPTVTVTDVLDAASYTKNIAQGSIFVVKGTNLSASGFTQFSFPLPATSAGVKITFTPAAGGTGTDAWLVYLYNQNGVNQLAGILPSTVAPGNYNVTVTNGTASAPVAVTVVQRKIGLITQDSTGSGLAVVQNYISAAQLDVDRFTTGSVSGTTISPARPGQVLIAWATGMGPVAGGDNTASPGFDFGANGVSVRVLVGGTSITPLYAGRAPGLAGADQINFTLPANVATGCTVPFQVSVNGALSNPSFIAIAPDANSNACVYPGFTAEQLKNFDNGGSYTVGSFGLTQISINIPGTGPGTGTFKTNAASGGFFRFTGFQLSGVSQYQPSAIGSGACQVIHTTSGASGGKVPSGTITGLDAGTVTLNGPAGSNIANLAFQQDAKFNSYSLSLGTEGLNIPGQTNPNTSLVAGTYTVAGNGGKDVGKFSAQVTLGSPLTVTGGLPATINRSAGLPLTWTGGNASDLVEIVGFNSVPSTAGGTSADTAEFICTTTAGQGGFTVPASVLTQLSATPAGSATSSGFIEVISALNPTTFQAPLTAGGNIDFGAFLALTGAGGTAVYQ